MSVDLLSVMVTCPIRGVLYVRRALQPAPTPPSRPWPIPAAMSPWLGDHSPCSEVTIASDSEVVPAGSPCVLTKEQHTVDGDGEILHQARSARAVCGFYVEGRSSCSLEALTGGVVTTDRTTGTVRVTMPAGTTQERMAEVYALALPDMPLSVLLEVACPS